MNTFSSNFVEFLSSYSIKLIIIFIMCCSFPTLSWWMIWVNTKPNRSVHYKATVKSSIYVSLVFGGIFVLSIFCLYYSFIERKHIQKLCNDKKMSVVYETSMVGKYPISTPYCVDANKQLFLP